ncbi:TRAP transporter large permease [Seohaeicola zhoushanensis]|uniref:TRAP transporter large permease protein n=1 Tax=Seohaeicola zhoushanensis TaxID=1569283 RepID=A0A8J3H3C5_9RHOB|nr:TRAP transporter large permease [Seohaeicola zhoushanensis]GHF72181.1 C4-dicarboxylate ABC transporter permease [Seohaeicola zhoushanensis]
MIEALIGFSAVLVLVFLRTPIAFAMGIVGVAGYAAETNMTASLSLASRIIADTAQDYGLTVIPLFILMGMFVNQSGMSTEIYRVSHATLGHLRGGLALATILACGIFAALSGSSLATAATMSRVAIPEMRRHRYSDRLSTASIAAGGTLGILIPPSVALIIFGILTETSIASLFLAGVIPGLMGILFYMAAVRFVVWRDPAAGPAGPRSTWGERLRALTGVWTVLLLFVAVIGGLYGVFDFAPLNLTFSPTEAAGIGAAGTFLIALVRRRLTFRLLKTALFETARTSASLFAVLIGAWIFSNYINYVGMADQLLAMIKAADFPAMGVIFLIVGVYLILGCVFESLSMMLLTVPVFYPLVAELGFDLVWFGIVVVVVTEISLITPPVGMNVFVLKGIVRDVPTAEIFRGVTPFWVADIARLLLIVLIPGLSLMLVAR